MCGPAASGDARPRPAGVPLFGCLPPIIAQFAYRRNGDLRTRGGGPQSLPCKGLRSRAPPAAEKAVSHAANGRHSFYYRLFGDRKHRTALRSPLRSLPLRGNAAVAERKCASAHAARCGHRKPDGGCAARRRRRGALPPGGGNTRQSPAGPCPASVGDDARIVPQPLQYRKPQAAGEIARPTKPPGAGGNAQTSAIRQARRRADESIGPYAGDGAAGRRGKLPDAGAPSAVPRSAARLPCIVGRAFTPAGEVCGGPEGYWQGKVPHPSVG